MRELTDDSTREQQNLKETAWILRTLFLRHRAGTPHEVHVVIDDQLAVLEDWLGLSAKQALGAAFKRLTLFRFPSTP